jgi:integrase
MGYSHVARLDRSDIDFDRGVIDNYRKKTEVRRVAPLWPETIQALRESLDLRPRAREPELADRAFLHVDGGPVVREILSREAKHLIDSRERDWVQERFSQLQEALGIKRKGRSFYSLRRTFRTLADESRDDRACAVIMAHSVGDVAELYIWNLARDRLVHVVSHVYRQTLAGWACDVRTRSQCVTPTPEGDSSPACAAAPAAA